MSCLFDELLYFDPAEKTLDTYNLIILGVAIMIFSNLIFMSILKIFGSQVTDEVEAETKDGFNTFKDKNVNPQLLYLSDILNSVIYAPITEELFFRFFLYKTILIRKFKLNIHLANFIQAFIFGGFHITNQIFTEQKGTTTMVQILSATISGMINGYAYKYSNSIIPSLVSHALNNALASTYNFQKYDTFYKNATATD